ncbi:HAD family hydrolase [Candidatus Woesearchaeota archaeon]|nr:HAD family hydrolase [Candidatus Woesearchaeota archaeon]
MVSIVLFDVGNVVVKADHDRTHRILHDQHHVLLEKAPRFFTNPDYAEFGRGNITDIQFHAALRKHLELDLGYGAAFSAHNAHIYELDRHVVGLIEETKQRKCIGFLTDTNAWQTYRVEAEMIQLINHSPYVFRSNELHALKTDPECFPKVIARLEEQLGIGASNIALVDDSVEKLAMAEKAGLVCILYQLHKPDKYTMLQRDLEKV